MAVVNHVKREINAKIIYFGPPGCGKHDLLHFIHQRIKPSLCGPLKSMAAGHDTLIFFDYLPFESTSLNGYTVRFHLYTLTGPVANPGTWKMTLKGADGLVFVTSGDAQDTPGESFRVLQSMLNGYGRGVQSLPRIWLSCDAESVTSEDLEVTSAFGASRTVPCSRASGHGILQSLAQLSQEVLQKIREEQEPTAEFETRSSALDHAAANQLSGTGVEEPLDSLSAVVSPELRVTFTGDSVVRIPVSIQGEDGVTQCILSLSLKLEKG